MKKYFILLIFVLIPFHVVKASELIDVSLVRCVDGDTAVFNVDGEEIKFRFLAIDTPETVHPTKGEEEGGKVASTYTCESLTNAQKLQIAYDDKSSKTDKYGRGLAWIYVDDKLLQEDLVEKGYAEVAYIYAKYEFVDYLCEVQAQAKSEKIGIWSEDREEGYCLTKSNTTATTTKTSDNQDDDTTSTTTTKKTSISDEDDLIAILEDMIDSNTCIPIAVVLCVLLGIVKTTKKSSKKK